MRHPNKQYIVCNTRHPYDQYTVNMRHPNEQYSACVIEGRISIFALINLLFSHYIVDIYYEDYRLLNSVCCMLHKNEVS